MCVCLMGEHYALSGCDLTSRVRSVVRKGKARILNFAVSQVLRLLGLEKLSAIFRCAGFWQGVGEIGGRVRLWDGW